jgi:hypothetical protein
MAALRSHIKHLRRFASRAELAGYDDGVKTMQASKIEAARKEDGLPFIADVRRAIYKEENRLGFIDGARRSIHDFGEGDAYMVDTIRWDCLNIDIEGRLVDALTSDRIHPSDRIELAEDLAEDLGIDLKVTRFDLGEDTYAAIIARANNAIRVLDTERRSRKTATAVQQ